MLLMRISRRIRTRLLFAATFSAGTAAGCLLFEWLAMVIGAVVAGVRLPALRIHDHLWLDFPNEFQVGHSQLYAIIKGATIVMLIGGGAVGALLGLSIWRHVVVDRLHWMTNEEVEEFYKKDPGF
jgi:hypothetical protein